MSTRAILSCLLAVPLTVATAAPAGKPAQAEKSELKMDREQDTFTVAETLYRQGYMEGQTPAMRDKILERAQVLLGNFVKEYPESGLRSKALYMQATCLSTLKKEADKMRELQALAASGPGSPKDEYIATAAYIVATGELAAAQKGTATEKKIDAIIKLFETVESRTAKPSYRYDSMYRRARALTLKAELLQGKKRNEAYTQAASVYRRLSAQGKEVPENIAGVLPYTFGQLLVAQGGDENLKAAFDEFERFIQSGYGDASVRSVAVLQAARLASKFGKSDQAATYYDMLNQFDSMKGYKAEAGLEIISSYYRAGKIDAIYEKYKPETAPATFLKEIENDRQRAACAAILGQVYLQKDAVSAAAEMFRLSESAVSGTARGADSGYRYVLCQHLLSKSSQGDIGEAAEAYLQKYSSLTDDKSQNLVNMVRALYADRLLTVSAEQALKIYEVLDTKKLVDSSVATEAEYKRIWCMFHVWSASPSQKLADALEKYMVEFTAERKHAPQLPEVWCMRGKFLYAQDRRDAAIQAYEEVILSHKNSTVYPHCLQLAARACMPEQKAASSRQDMSNYKPEYAAKALKYYTALLEMSNTEAKDSAGNPRGVTLINSYAKAEAEFNLGCLYFNKDVAQAIKMFNAAAESNVHYKPEVDYCLIQCYCKQGNEGKDILLASIQEFKKNYKEDYAKLPKEIPAHCAALWYNEDPNSVEMCTLAVEYYNDALARCKQESYTSDDGQTANRPVADSREWYKLAKACLEAGIYASQDHQIGGLDAVNHYLSLETDTQRKAVGMGMKAGMLMGTGQYEEAIKLCDEAGNLGVSGPTLSRLRLISGDAGYLMGNYDFAAERYAVVANFDRDNNLQRESCYKLACALRKSGKVAEAEKYEQMLKEKLKAMDLKETDNPLQGLPPSVTRHIK